MFIAMPLPLHPSRAAGARKTEKGRDAINMSLLTEQGHVTQMPGANFQSEICNQHLNILSLCLANTLRGHDRCGRERN